MNYWLLLLLQIAPLVLVIYYYVHQKYKYWSNMGVSGPVPSLLKFGNVFQIAANTNPPMNEVEMVRKYGKVYGTYVGLEPTLTVADADIIKRIMVKDFHLFVNRRKLWAYHEMVNTNQFQTDGDNWKRMRSITSPSFTSGKLRGMHGMMAKCVDKLVAYFDKEVASTGATVINTKEVFTGFTLDVIASTSFATETNINNDRTAKNPIVHNASQIGTIPSLQSLSYLTMPGWFNNMVKAQHLFNYQSMDFFRDLTTQIVEQRKKSGGKRNDFVQLLMDAYVYENELKDSNYSKLEADFDEKQTEQRSVGDQGSAQRKSKLSDLEIVSQSILFMSAGFETTASVLTHSIFEMSRKPEVQERLFTELTTALDGLDQTSEEYFETVTTKIPYLEAIIKETLRKYPALVRLERRFDGSREYKVNGIPLKKDQLVEISTYGVHYSEEYYPNPFEFNPDRFMPENKHKLVPYTFLPFGQGPRNCVGLRFALQEIKLCLATIVRKYRFVATDKTPSSLAFNKFSFIATTEPFSTLVEKR